MRNNFLNLVAYDPIAEPCAAKMPQNTGGGTSRTKNRSVTVNLSSDTTTNREMTERRPREDRETFVLRSSLLGTLKYIACMLLAFILGIGQMWGATETITVISNGTTTGSGIMKNMANSQAGATLTGCTVSITWANNSSSVSSTYYADVKDNSSAVDAKCLRVSVNSGYKINSIKYYLSNEQNSDTDTDYGILAWDNDLTPALTNPSYAATGAVFKTKKGTFVPQTESFTSLTDVQINDVRIYRKISGVTYGEESDLAFGTKGKNLLVQKVDVTVEEIPSGPVDPVFTYTASTYNVGDPALDLSTKLTSTNTSGAISFAVSTADAGTTGASIADGKNFMATTAGTATITVSQAASTGFNAKSQDITVTVVSCTKPGTPGSLSVEGKTHNAANLTWSAAENADGYKVSIIKKADASVVLDWTDCATNSSAASGLIPETAYTFKVKAKGASGYCEYGAEASVDFTTNADPCATYFWFSKAADATTAGVTNNEGGFFTTSASGSNETTSSITIDEVEYAITNRTSNIGADDATIVSFTIPANKAGVLYVNMASSGNKGESSSRTLYLKKGGVTVVTATDAIYGDGAQHNATIENIPSGTYTLHANNNVKVGMFAVKACDATYHTITLDLDGGTGATSIAALDGVPAYKPADPTKANNTFSKWGVKSTSADYNWSSNVTGDIELKAIWTPYPTLTLNAGEGSGTEVATQYAPSTEITAPAKPDGFSYTGYSFTGWKDGSDNDYAVGDPLTITADITLTAQWALNGSFDVKFFQGYGDPDAQIGTTQSISTGNYATAPDDPTRTGFAFLGWSTDGTEAKIVDVAAYAIIGTTNFTAVWKQVWTVTFDGAGNVNVEDGETVASPNSPTQDGKIFQGWYNGESKYDFSAAVTGNLALESKWAAANPNHFYYTYNDDFHFDGVVYKTPEGKTTDPEADEATLNLTTPYTVYSGAEGITSIIATNGVYDYKKGADTKHVTAYLKLKKNDATSNLAFTIKSGYTAVLKIKMGGYSNNPVVTLKKGDDAVPATSGTIGGTATGKNYYEITYNLTAGTYVMTSADQTLYISHIDLEATALPTYTVTYKAGEGTGDDVVDADATEVRDGSTMFTAPEGKIFNGWKDGEDNDVEVGAIVSVDMALTAQWINHYAVTFNMNGHGDAIDPQDIKEGAKATRPDDPVAIGFDFGGWFTDNGTFEAPFDFNTLITAATPLYAKWTAFDGCTLLVPATSGDAPAVGDPISMQTGSKGGSMSVVGTPLSYNAYGLSFESSSSAKAKVTINNEIQEGTVISLTLVANGTSAPRGLHLYTGDGATKIESLGWNSEVVKYTEATFTYIVKATDVALIGSNEFQLWRNGSVFLKKLTVTNCGDAITFHNLTSAVNIAGKGTVTLGASSVREGYTTTATYSEIDPLYEFVNWTVSGAGASIADASANPATITMGTEDAVVTLNLQVKPVYYTVTYYDGASQMGTEQVAENGHPSATSITTKKLGYNFLGWSEIDGGVVVELNNISITDAKNLYAKYEAVVCPTSGTVYKFQLKTDLADGNVFDTKPNSVAFTTDNYLSALTGGILTGSIDNNNVNRLQFFDNKAVGFASGSGGTLTIGLDCELAEGDVIKYINYANSGNKMTLSDATHTQTLDGNGTEEVQTWEVPAAWAGATELTLVRGGNTPKLTYFEIYRRPVATGATLADLTIRQGQSKTPVMTLEPSADARVTSQAWEIVGTPTNLTGAAINSTTGAITTGTLDDPTSTGSISVKVTLNGSIEATCTATIVGNIDQQDVTKSTVWDWHNTGATANIQLNNDTDPKKNENFVLANVAVNNNDEFESDKLAVEGEHIVRDYNKTNPYFQGQLIQFHTTVAGVVRVKFAHTGDATAEKPARELYINGVATGDSRDNATPEWSNYIEVPAGDVSITAHYVNLLPAAAQQYIRVFEIEFFAVGHERTLVVGDLGTVCLPKASIARGVTVYEYQGADEIGKIVFDELGANELLVAGKPYIFQVNETNARFFYNTDPAVTTEKNETALKGNLGDAITFQPGSTEAEHVYFVKDHAFWMAKNTGVKIGQYRCYLQMNEVQSVSSQNPAPGRRRIVLGVQGEQVATGIGELNASEAPVKVMIDGQLFIIRGEKMYNANGQLVK